MSIYVVLMLKFFNNYSMKSLKMTLDGKSIRTVAPQRALDDHTFSTLPGSPFQDLAPTAHPMAEPRRRGRENDEIRSAGPLKKLIHL